MLSFFFFLCQNGGESSALLYSGQIEDFFESGVWLACCGVREDLVGVVI